MNPLQIKIDAQMEKLLVETVIDDFKSAERSKK